MSNHVLAEVMELSDRVVVIDRGTVRANAPPRELIANTGTHDLESAFVALARRVAS
jgi:ABC-type Na+ transport system ATPase subunit NatA